MLEVSLIDLAKLALLCLFLPPYLFLLVRHLQGRGRSSLFSGGRASCLLTGLGIVLVALSGTLPLAESMTDALVIVGLILLLVGGWLGRNEASPAPAKP